MKINALPERPKGDYDRLGASSRGVTLTHTDPQEVPAMPIRALDDGELDTAGLEADVEAAFGVTIPNEEAERTMTVGQLHRLILRKLGHTPTADCPGAAAFYRVRAALREEFALDRAAVRPATRLEDVIGRPAADRWGRIAARLGIEQHRLTRSRLTRTSMLGVSLAIGLVAVNAALMTSVGVAGAIGLGVLALALAWAAAIAATRVLAVHPPFATVADLTWAALPASLAEVARRTWTPAERAVWNRLVKIVAEFYGTRPGALMPTTRFVGDIELGKRLLAWLGAK